MDDFWKYLQVAERAAASQGLDADLVADLSLEVFLRCKELYQPSESCTFRGYFSAALRREFFAYKRRTKTETFSLFDDEEPEDFRHSDEDPISQLEGSPDVALERLRSQLTADEFKLLWMRFVDDRSLEDIGIEFGVIRQTVWARIEKILARIRRAT